MDTAALCFMPAIAFGTATATCVSQSLGAGKPNLAARYGWESVRVGMYAMAVIGVVFWCFPEQVIGLLAPNDAAVREAAAPSLRIVVAGLPLMVVGLVLAGGRSVRFGGEKAVALLEGRPLLAWAAERLESVCLEVAINVRTGTEAESVAKALGLSTLYDAPGDALGPLAGVKAGLIWAEERGARVLAVSPCDAPLLPDDLYVRLLERSEGGAAMAETRDGPQPLCALWPITALPEAVKGIGCPLAVAPGPADSPHLSSGCRACLPRECASARRRTRCA